MFPAFPIGCSQSHFASDCHSALLPQLQHHRLYVTQARFMGEARTFIRLIDRVQSLFVPKLASFSRCVRWLNKMCYLPL